MQCTYKPLYNEKVLNVKSSSCTFFKIIISLLVKVEYFRESVY